jgi:DNA ligase (NAD+)
MDIDGLGPSVLELLENNDLVKSPADLYKLRKDDIKNLDRMGEQSAANITNAISASKDNDLSRVLTGLGINMIGKSAAKVICKKFSTIDSLMTATIDDLTSIDGIGQTMAENICSYFALPQSKALIQELKDCGLKLEEPVIAKAGGIFENKNLVLTGTLPTLKRAEAAKLIEDNGGKVVSGVSKKTDYVVAGEAAGSKLDKANKLGITVLTEEQFLSMIQNT